MSHAFGVGLHRVELDVYAFNTRARHVYEKLGFVLEGTKRAGPAVRRRLGGLPRHGPAGQRVARLNRLPRTAGVCKAATD